MYLVTALQWEHRASQQEYRRCGELWVPSKTWRPGEVFREKRQNQTRTLEGSCARHSLNHQHRTYAVDFETSSCHSSSSKIDVRPRLSRQVVKKHSGAFMLGGSVLLVACCDSYYRATMHKRPPLKNLLALFI